MSTSLLDLRISHLSAILVYLARLHEKQNTSIEFQPSHHQLLKLENQSMLIVISAGNQLTLTILDHCLPRSQGLLLIEIDQTASTRYPTAQVSKQCFNIGTGSGSGNSNMYLSPGSPSINFSNFSKHYVFNRSLT